MRCSWLLCLLVTTVLGAPAEEGGSKGKKWAVLISGSNEFFNYGDQADICHAYQILHRHGIPDENIIVFMYDDIAHNKENPRPGVIINRPNGTDVYKGVKKDYVGVDVTPKNFLAVLTGDQKAAGGKKVLDSGPDDHVFIYFADHGDHGMMLFPTGNLYAHDLVNALKTMHKKKMYNKLLLFIETCYSGSMVQGLLPNNINILTVTASNAKEVAWRTYCDDKEYNDTCLGNDFGVAWMEKTDRDEGAVLQKETINDQYKEIVKSSHKAEWDSYPKLYGQKKIKHDLIKDFIGVDPNPVTSVQQVSAYRGPKVSVQDSYLFYLNRKIEMASNKKGLMTLLTQKSMLMEGRKVIDELFSNIMARVEATDDEINTRSQLTMEVMPCYKTLVEAFRQQCVNNNKNTYVQAHTYKLANLCARDNFSPQQVLPIFATECTQLHRQLNRVN